LRNTPQAFRLVWSAGRSAALVGMGLRLIAALLPAAQAWAGKLLIDAIVSASSQGMEITAGFRSVLPYLVLELALVLVGSLVGQACTFSDRILQQQLTNHINTLVMRKAEVLVLDEPTASLDAEAEYEGFQRFGQLMEGRIAVLISHRFSTVRMADRIVLLSAGKIVELGSHAELMARDGAYARLFNLQAEGYR